METNNISNLNRIFTRNMLRHFINGKVDNVYSSVIRRYISDADQKNNRELISEIYCKLKNSYRNEYFYKNTILNQLLIEKHDLYNTAAITELPIGTSKADFIMINGRGVVYEIKTDLDNLIRLDNQINDYYKVFSYVNVVVGNRQLSHVKEFLKNKPVGIYVLNKEGNLRCRKKADYYTDKLSHEAMFQVLRKAEFESIIIKKFHKLPAVNNFQYYRECLKWFGQINIFTAQREVMKCLKNRTLLRVENKIEEEVPYQLRFYAYFSKKIKLDYRIINTFWNRKIGG